MDVYEIITERIIKELEKGRIPWDKPWIAAGSGAAAFRHVNCKPYSLLNQFLLEKPGEYVSWKDVQNENAKMQKKNNDFKTTFCKVKKDEKASIVVGWIPKEIKPTQKQIEQAEETGIPLKKKTIPIPKYYYVYHIDQCEGISPKMKPPVLPNGVESDEKAEEIIDTYVTREGIRLQYVEGDRAFYRPSTDEITLPTKAQFKNTSEFYGTAFHEMVHSTGHISRLNRLVKEAAFGNEEYSKEELVAEIGSAALLNQCNLETEHSTRNTAAYVQSWLKVLQNDKKFIFGAASRAENAVKFILGESTKSENHNDEEE